MQWIEQNNRTVLAILNAPSLKANEGSAQERLNAKSMTNSTRTLKNFKSGGKKVEVVLTATNDFETDPATSSGKRPGRTLTELVVMPTCSLRIRLLLMGSFQKHLRP